MKCRGEVVLRSSCLGVFVVKSLSMSRSLLALLFIGFPFFLIAQESVTIQGKVTDAVNLQPLPFAQIALSGSTLGTVSNEEGLFRLTIPLLRRSASHHEKDTGYPDTLLVSFLGYQTEMVTVSSFDSGILELFLLPVSFDLREVEIVALTPGEVLRRAFDSIPVNYGSDPVILTAFIRSQKTVNNKLAEYTEAILKITYKPSYKTFETYEKTKYSRTWYLNHQPGWIQEMPLGETTITYAKRDSLWSLNTIQNHYRITYLQPQKNQRIIYGYKNEVVVTDLTPRSGIHPDF